MTKIIEEQIHDRLMIHLQVAEQFGEELPAIASAVEMIVETFRAEGKLLLAGNGGSAADAQHWAAEWVIRLTHDLDRPSMPAIALSTDTSVLTAGANDLGFDQVFARQVEGLGNRGDLLIVISTSGNSRNLLHAVEVARFKGMRILGVLGGNGGKLLDICDHAVVVKCVDTQRIQEMHAFVGHCLCELSERALHQ